MTGATPEVALDSGSLARYLDGPHREVRERVRTLLAEPRRAKQPADGADTDEDRQRALEQCRILAGEGLGRLHVPGTYGGDDDPAAYLSAVETLGHGDLSLLVTFGVQFGLFTGSLLGLGTRFHHERYLERASRFELTGCFAMTEMDHGSNVRDLETVARYDPSGESFVIDTPHDGAVKDYIAGALTARVAVVFARLVTGGEDHGVHPFLVPLRDDDGRLLPGRRVEDRGRKAGLNGVANGRLALAAVRVPRSALLDRFGSVASDGTYSSPIDGQGARFLAMLGTLVPGRVGVAAAALSAAKTALTIAVRYGAQRRQFGPNGEREQPILDYVTHQRRLLPALASTYALHFAVRHAGQEALAAFEEGRTGDDRRRVDALAAGVKAATTWHALATAQTCRETCGAQGYLAENRLGLLRADLDAFTTFEGDNTVMLQLTARSLLTDLRSAVERATRTDLARHLSRPVPARFASRRRLRERRFQIEALRWRERHLVLELGRRMRSATHEGLAADEAFFDTQDHGLEAASAYVEQVVLERFAAAVAGCPDPNLRPSSTSSAPCTP